MEFKDKVVLITGGCSGIGKIMARKSLERSCKHLILLDINEQGLQNVKRDPYASIEQRAFRSSRKPHRSRLSNPRLVHH